MAVLACELTASLDPTDPYTVDLTYRLEAVGDPTALEFTILEAKGARVDHVRVNGTEVTLDRSRAPQLRGTIAVPKGASSVTFRYDVIGTTIPLAVPVAGMGEAQPGVFLAKLRIPEGVHVIESFPTGVRESAEGHVLELPILPAFVSLTLAAERSWLSFPVLMDALALLVLGSVGVVALRRR